MEKIEEEVVVSNVHGLHARPAALFVQLAKEFDSSVMLEREGEVVDGKSIIAILSLGVNNGMNVKLIVEGNDAQDAVSKLKNFLEKSND
jgi:phosphocarrier protein